LFQPGTILSQISWHQSSSECVLALKRSPDPWLSHSAF
jgi:hypothetical protein